MHAKVWRLDFAHITCKDSILSLGGNVDTATLIGCFGYLILFQDEYIVVDCGIEDLKTVNKTKTSKDDWKHLGKDGSILDNLSRLKVCPEQISKVFITHSHYDHLSGVIHFKNAQIYMTEKEYEFLHSEENAHQKYLEEAITFLDAKKEKGTLHLLEDTYEESGIKCRMVGGHTPGSMLVYIDKFLFTGDVVYLLDNIKAGIPIGFSLNPWEAKKAVELCGQHTAIILTGHDVKCPEEA